MEYDDKVFVIVRGGIKPATIKFTISLKGVVTGYEVRLSSPITESLSKFVKKDVFADEEAATKALFIRNLKTKDEEVKVPAEDKRGGRRFPGFKKRRW